MRVKRAQVVNVQAQAMSLRVQTSTSCHVNPLLAYCTVTVSRDLLALKGVVVLSGQSESPRAKVASQHQSEAPIQVLHQAARGTSTLADPNDLPVTSINFLTSF